MSKKENGFARRKQANDFAEATDHVNKNEEVAAEVWHRLTAVEEALRYVIYVLLERANGAFMYHALHTDHTNREKWAMYEPQAAKASECV